LTTTSTIASFGACAAEFVIENATREDFSDPLLYIPL